MSLTTPGKIRELQIKLYQKAKNEPEFRLVGIGFTQVTPMDCGLAFGAFGWTMLS
jgi:hypothetical protein